MATTPEEFFVEGLIEPSPTSPSVFLDLPPVPNPDADKNGHLSHSDESSLSYILRMLMEEDSDPKILPPYSDHPGLLQAHESFAQILSSPSIAENNDSTVNKDSMDGLQDGRDDQNTLSLAFSKGDYAAGALLKGMEEASRFLPMHNTFIEGHQMNQMSGKSSSHRVLKKRHNCDEDLEGEAGRSSKIMMVMEEPEENDGLSEMFDEMMLYGYETCVEDMGKLRITKANESEKKNKKGVSEAVKGVVDLRALLLHCAQAVDTNDHIVAAELLKQIKQHATASGDATQRLAQCFSRGLEARLAATGSQLWKLPTSEHPAFADFLKAYKLYMAACCFNKVAHVFSTMTIVQAMEGKSRLHIVDYGMYYAFQWADLIGRLSKREGGPPEVKITAIARYRPRSCLSQQIEEQGHRLSKRASEFGLPFKFRAVTKKWEEVCIENLEIDDDEVLVVNDLFNFSTLLDESLFFDDPNPRDTVLSNISKMRPNIFIQSILNCSYGTCFLTRFRESLFYCGTLFDMFDTIIPRDNESRLVLEQGLFGRCILNTIACEGVGMVERPERYRQWRARNQRAGLRQLPLKPDIVKALKNKIKKHHHKGFFLGEDGQWLLQGWKGRPLFAHSTWVAEDASSE